MDWPVRSCNVVVSYVNYSQLRVDSLIRLTAKTPGESKETMFVTTELTKWHPFPDE